MALADLSDWMAENSRSNVIWYVKRLSANDTLATGAHQAGPYIPKDFLFRMFPSLYRPETENPDPQFALRIDSHGDVRQARAVWYNNKLRSGTRNETRLTGFGGASSALLDPDNTGAIVIFAFHHPQSGDATICNVWVCDDESGIEADLVEERLGPIEPGRWLIWSIDSLESDPGAIRLEKSSCWLDRNEIPPEWLLKFPSTTDIIRKTIELRGEHAKPVDIRLMRRRECEFEIFQSVEQAVELPLIQKGFPTVDDFVVRAQTILQRRKSRSGRSLELHIRKIFIEELLQEDQDFSFQPESDPGKRPDFLFPSQAAYQNASFPSTRLRMLAVKTTCKDRWRQIVQEANRINLKHLLTLQEGVSEGQFREMIEAGICLVVPEILKKAYPNSIQQHLQSLESFIGDIKHLNLNAS